MRAASTVVSEVSGAFADLGTFLPLAVGTVLVSGLDVTGVLTGFGVFALAVALFYRRPVPVQPMKAVAAIAIAGGLTPGIIAGTGVLMGAALVLLALSGIIERVGRWVPQSVLAGIQVGVGLGLAVKGLALMDQHPYVGLACLALLLVFLRTAAAGVAALLVVGGAALWALRAGTALPSAEPLGLLHLPHAALPTGAELTQAATTTLLPQLPLTLANAVLATAAVAATLFPEDAHRITPKRLALSSGVLNLLLAPLGAMPMCHGAGGLVAQHRFGARTGIAPAVFGATCLALALLLGPRALDALAMIPAAPLGALLAVAGVELVLTRRLFDGRPRCLAVIVATAATALVADAAYAVLAGIALELGWTAVRRAAQRGVPS